MVPWYRSQKMCEVSVLHLNHDAALSIFWHLKWPTKKASAQVTCLNEDSASCWPTEHGSNIWPSISETSCLFLTFVDSNSWLEDRDFARDGLRINRRRVRRLSQLYSRIGGLSSSGKKREWQLMRNASNKGSSERTRETTIQENSTPTWRTTGIAEGTTNQERRETEVVPSEERAGLAWSTQAEGKPLAFLQVNCRSIWNKILEFWNLIDTYNPDVVIGTESWLSEEINNAEVFRDDYIT